MNFPLQCLKLTIRCNRMKMFCNSVCPLSSRFCSSNANSDEDVIAIFTEHLIHRKLEKSFDIKGCDIPLSDSNYNLLLKQNMDENELELMDSIKKYLQKYLDRRDVPVVPSTKLLNSLAYYFIQRNDLEGLQLIINVRKLDYVDFVKHGEFAHLLIEFHSKHDLAKAFHILHNYYDSHKQVHYLMKFAVRKMIDHVVTHRSEAILVNLIAHVKQFSSHSRDYYPLLVLWKILFSSTWYTDQVEAKELFFAHPPLQLYVSVVCVTFALDLLSRKKVQVVESLLEYFLKLRSESGDEKKYDKQCMHILRALFDYQCLTKNLRACTEIVKSSYELQLPLSEEQKIQFFNVLLKQPIQRKLITPLHKNIYPIKF